MFGDKALELVRELKRAMDGALPPYNVSLHFDRKWREIELTNFNSKSQLNFIVLGRCCAAGIGRNESAF